MATTKRRDPLTGRIGRTLRHFSALLTFWLAASFARADAPISPPGPVHEGTDFEYCRFKVVFWGGQQCQPPLAADAEICLPCDSTPGRQSSCPARGTLRVIPILSPNGLQEVCRITVESLGGECGACAVVGTRTFTDDPIEIALGTFVLDGRDKAEEGQKFCVYSVAELLIKPDDPDTREGWINCAVHVNQNVCLPCPAGGACQLTGVKVKANLDTRADRMDCPVILVSKGGGACVNCPPGGALFKAP